MFDGKKDGRITVEELWLVLSSLGFSEGSKIKDCKEMIRMVDVDGDGMIDFEEFEKMMTQGLGRLIQFLDGVFADLNSCFTPIKTAATTDFPSIVYL